MFRVVITPFYRTTASLYLQQGINLMIRLLFVSCIIKCGFRDSESLCNDCRSNIASTVIAAEQSSVYDNLATAAQSVVMAKNDEKCKVALASCLLKRHACATCFKAVLSFRSVIKNKGLLEVLRDR